MTDQWLVRKLLEQDKKIEALSRGGTGVGHTSIAPGEALTVISEDGEVVLGAGGVDYVDGPTPATPSAPALKLGFGTIEVTWDGSFAAGEDENGIPLVAPIDFDVAEVHCSTDPLEEEWGDDTRRGQIKTREGGTITVGGFDVDDEVFVCLIALAKTGKRSAPSATASLVIEGLDFSQLFNELDAANATIKNAGEILVTEQGTLGEKLAESDAALGALEVSLGELDETTLPALRNDLDAAEGRLDSAEGQITDAFGELALVPGQITDATQDALILAATDAQARADAAQAAADEAARAYAEAIATGIEPVDLDALRDHMNTKAAQAKQAAIDAAALDATAKANAAKDAAQAWDTALSTSINDTIDTARTELEADISAAQSTATQALTSANTKNKVTRSTSRPPAAYDGRVDDVWFTMSSMGSGGRVLFQEMWNGTTWVSVTIDSQVIAYLDAAKITTGYLNVATLIEAGAITADKLIVGQGENLLPMTSVNAGISTKPHVQMPNVTPGLLSNPERNYKNALLYTLNSSVSAFTSVARLSSGGQSGDLQYGHAFPVIGGSQYLLDGVVLRSGEEPNGQPAVRIQAVAHNSTGGWAGTFNSDSYFANYDTSVKVGFSLTIPESAAFVAFYLQIDKAGSVGLLNPRLARKAGTTLIEGGAVTTDKLAANVLEVGNLKAGTAAIAEAVVAKIAAQTASIQQADIKNLFVTGTSSLSNVVAERIAAETAKFIELEVGNLVAGTGTMDTATINKLFTDVVVAGMSIATEFIGENAILTGAVTASKITASEELWAKIGEFVQIRAEQIEADAIDGMVITGAKVQSSATNPKSQMSTSGFESFAADGSRTFFADAVTGDVNMTGSFYSNYDGLPRVEINNDDWADIEVVGEDGVPRFVNGSGIRLGSTAMDGVSIFHGSWNTAGGASGQAATFEGPLGKSRLQLLDSGRLEIQSGPSAGTVNARIGTFANGSAYVISYKEGGGESTRLSVDSFGRGRFSAYGGSNGVIPMGRLLVDEALGAELVSQTTAGTFGARVRAGTDKTVTLQGESVNVNVNDAAGGRLRATAVYNVTSSGGDRVHVNAGGTLFRYLTSSSLRYKQNIVPAEGKPSILDVVPVTWSYKEEVERAEAAKQYLAEHGDGPLPREFDMAEIEPPRLYGAIAEDVHEIGLTELVKYDFAGRPDGLDYEKFGVALIPVVRELRDRVTELETKLETT